MPAKEHQLWGDVRASVPGWRRGPGLSPVAHEPRGRPPGTLSTTGPSRAHSGPAVRGDARPWGGQQWRGQRRPPRRGQEQGQRGPTPAGPSPGQRSAEPRQAGPARPRRPRASRSMGSWASREHEALEETSGHPVSGQEARARPGAQVGRWRPCSWTTAWSHAVTPPPPRAIGWSVLESGLVAGNTQESGFGPSRVPDGV